MSRLLFPVPDMGPAEAQRRAVIRSELLALCRARQVLLRHLYQFKRVARSDGDEWALYEALQENVKAFDPWPH